MTAVMEAPPPSNIATIDHLSFSSLKTFTLCPRKWAFKNLEHAVEEFKPSIARVWIGVSHGD